MLLICLSKSYTALLQGSQSWTGQAWWRNNNVLKDAITRQLVYSVIQCAQIVHYLHCMRINSVWHCNIIQIMNVYECNGTNIFMRWKMKCSIQRGAKPSWMVHFIFHRMKIFVPLHEWENIHYLFYISCKKFKFLNIFERKIIEKRFWLKQNWFYKPRVQLHAGSITQMLALR